MGDPSVYSGWLCERDYGEAMDVVFLGDSDEPLCRQLSWMSTRQVNVRYWITDKEVSLVDAQEAFLRQVLGAADVDYFDRYSEYTGYLWTDEELVVGGHDLLREFRSHLGKWLILEVTDVTEVRVGKVL